MPARFARTNAMGLSFGRRNAATERDNRRCEQRFRFSTSVLLLNPQNSVSATTIDVSDSGARIRLDRSVILRPDWLFSVKEFGIVVPLVIVWRFGLELGVRFVSGHPTAVQEQNTAPSFGRRGPPLIETRIGASRLGPQGPGTATSEDFRRG